MTYFKTHEESVERMNAILDDIVKCGIKMKHFGNHVEVIVDSLGYLDVFSKDETDDLINRHIMNFISSECGYFMLTGRENEHIIKVLETIPKTHITIKA